jgi:hypothetical protein
MRHAAITVVALLLSWQVLACQCLGGRDPIRSVPNYDEVFMGEVVATETRLVGVDGTPPPADECGLLLGFAYRVAVFQVSEKWKGRAGRFTLLVSGSGAADCGFVFEVGKQYLVYARATTEKPYTTLVGGDVAMLTSICTPTALLETDSSVPNRIRENYPSIPVP